ncbi:MAG: hypothetical protein RBJ76_04305 [Stenomitos frigidus ULC029]
MSIKIKIDADIWTPLSVEEQNEITEILKSTKLLDEGDSIEASSSPVLADAQAVVTDPQSFISDWWKKNKKTVCKASCDTAAAAAAAGCTGISSGIGVAACLAAAEAARQACRDAC